MCRHALFTQYLFQIWSVCFSNWMIWSGNLKLGNIARESYLKRTEDEERFVQIYRVIEVATLHWNKVLWLVKRGQIKQSNWFIEVTWLGTANQSALFHLREAKLLKNLLMAWATVYRILLRRSEHRLLPSIVSFTWSSVNLSVNETSKQKMMPSVRC